MKKRDKSHSKKIWIINGPNLDMLGKREPEIYGHDSLKDIQKYVDEHISDSTLEIIWRQSNSESEIIEMLHASTEHKLLGIIINPAAFTHTSLAIADALKITDCPVVEVHLTNTHARGVERQQKYTTSCVKAVLEGFGIKGYLMAIEYFLLPN